MRNMTLPKNKMKIFIFLFMLFLYTGCSTKQPNNIIQTQMEQKEIQKINIAKSGNFLFYAYLENGDRLTRISKNKLKVIGDEEIIRVYKNGYYPLFDIPDKHFLCGTGLATQGIGKGNKGYIFNKGNQTEQKPLLCNSHYLTTSIGKNIIRKILKNKSAQ